MTITLKVEGMTCQHCVKAITGAIKARDPAAEVAIDLAAKTVRADTSLDAARLGALITEEGYQVAA